MRQSGAGSEGHGVRVWDRRAVGLGANSWGRRRGGKAKVRGRYAEPGWIELFIVGCVICQVDVGGAELECWLWATVDVLRRRWYQSDRVGVP